MKTFGDRTDELKAAAIRFCAAMASADVPAYWLSLCGPSGTGKTMVAQRIRIFFRAHIEDKLDENRGGRFRRAGGMLRWPRMIELMMGGDFGFMRQAGEDWLVILDDIGAQHERLRDLSASKLFSILNDRQGKFTVLTANLGVDEIADKLDTRIASRLLRHGGVVIDTTGTPDYSLR